METEEEYPGRYAVFFMDDYYPLGGFGDCVARVATREEADELAKKCGRCARAEVVDLLKEAGKRWIEIYMQK